MNAAGKARATEKVAVTRILIVDDNRDNMLTLGILLRSEGYIVELAKSGAEALRLATDFRPDVTLLDLLMPGQSGFDIARELRRRYGSERPVLIAITAHGGPHNHERAAMSGFHHFVEKPCDPNALLRLIESLG